MIYGLGSVPDRLSSKFGDASLCQTFDVIQPHSKIRQMFLWGIRGKPKDIIFIIKLRAKCFLLAMVPSWRKSFSLKELVGVRCNLKKLKKHPKIFQHLLIPYKRYKMLYRQMLKHQLHVGL
jgi:hypothetical protein